MNIALWIVAGLLAVAFLGAGASKLVTPKKKLYDKGMTYVEDFSDAQIKTIGTLEILGAIGLIVPAFISGATWLVPTAATGLLLTMIGAVVVHIRRKEQFVSPLVLGLLAAFVAVGRFWIETL
ncbi:MULTISPECIES: DoxX family protein [unclassified Amycolatopsis]|uniref:DoxX family protein n=1 Tax=unclassified Amycolatopsis TaxID=2618356 RepID=UPI0028764F38|nr:MULTISPECIES: DoxX family protein [unclassified Amycolatopsis]MDS0137720.1 DoxX family protein [Amycolatopsis sp. 505]MDS0141914.1 DoxX family protein [Amycolatopsis sp. CM201R]